MANWYRVETVHRGASGNISSTSTAFERTLPEAAKRAQAMQLEAVKMAAACGYHCFQVETPYRATRIDGAIITTGAFREIWK